MAECPGCHGEGVHDLRDQDAFLAEVLEDPPPPVGIVPCGVCGGSGEVTEDERKDMMAAARAAVDQIVALSADEEGKER